VLRDGFLAWKVVRDAKSIETAVLEYAFRKVQVDQGGEIKGTPAFGV
jgi:hypothetical protein